MIAEAADFAASVALAADRTLGEGEAWRPGAIGDDASAALSHALEAAGWLDLAEDPELAPMAGPAGIELGRRLAPLRDIDALLGGSPLVGTATAIGGLVRGGAEVAVTLAGSELVRHAVLAAEPVAYGDDAGVRRVTASHPLRTVPAGAALTAWLAASTGYLAGLADHALGIALAHAKDRRAFGTTLAALPPVQQRLADAATATRGLLLLAAERPGRPALAHAAAAAVEVTAAAHQTTGAIGFTLEFPLHRASRRARAMQLWADSFLS